MLWGAWREMLARKTQLVNVPVQVDARLRCRSWPGLTLHSVVECAWRPADTSSTGVVADVAYYHSVVAVAQTVWRVRVQVYWCA